MTRPTRDTRLVVAGVALILAAVFGTCGLTIAPADAAPVASVESGVCAG